MAGAAAGEAAVCSAKCHDCIWRATHNFNAPFPFYMQGGSSRVKSGNTYYIKIVKCAGEAPPLNGDGRSRATLTPKISMTRPALLLQAARSWNLDITALQVWNNELPATLPAGQPVTVWLVKPMWVTLTPKGNVMSTALLRQTAILRNVDIDSMLAWNNKLPAMLLADQPVTVWLVRPFAGGGK